MSLDETSVDHNEGEIEIFLTSLVAIGGWGTYKLEVLNDNKWEITKTIGKSDKDIYVSSTTVLKEHKNEFLFVFGKMIFSRLFINSQEPKLATTSYSDWSQKLTVPIGA